MDFIPLVPGNIYFEIMLKFSLNINHLINQSINVFPTVRYSMDMSNSIVKT